MRFSDNYYDALAVIKVLAEIIRQAQRWRTELPGVPNRLGVVHPDDIETVMRAIADASIRLKEIRDRE
jgi:hypothetical protein